MPLEAVSGPWTLMCLNDVCFVVSWLVSTDLLFKNFASMSKW